MQQLGHRAATTQVAGQFDRATTKDVEPLRRTVASVDHRAARVTMLGQVAGELFEVVARLRGEIAAATTAGEPVHEPGRVAGHDRHVSTTLRSDPVFPGRHTSSTPVSNAAIANRKVSRCSTGVSRPDPPPISVPSTSKTRPLVSSRKPASTRTSDRGAPVEPVFEDPDLALVAAGGDLLMIQRTGRPRIEYGDRGRLATERIIEFEGHRGRGRVVYRDHAGLWIEPVVDLAVEEERSRRGVVGENDKGEEASDHGGGTPVPPSDFPRRSIRHATVESATVVGAGAPVAAFPRGPTEETPP